MADPPSRPPRVAKGTLMLKSAILILLLFGSAFSVDEVPKLSPSDQAMLDKAVDTSLLEPSKVYDQYLAALGKAQEKAVKDLEKVKVDAMKKANLPLANAADAKIDEIKKGLLGDKIVTKSGEGLMGEKINIRATILGKWNWSWSGWNAFTFEKNGGFSNWWIPGGKWKIDGDSVLVEDNTWKYTIKVISKEELSVTRNDGVTNTMTKKLVK